MSRSKRPSSPPRDAMASLSQWLTGDDGAALLRVLGIMNSDGSISADSRRKLKQVVHLIPLLVAGMDPLPADRVIRIVDLNCGNAYLGLILRWWLEKQRVRCHLLGIDRDPARIDSCRHRARGLGLDQIDFEVGEAGTYPIDDAPFAIVSLHGCDTATDDALVRAVALHAEHLLAVPCCHREVKTLLKPTLEHAPFLNDGILAADHAATLTDALRSQWLRSQGYRTDTLEFVPWEHTPKNRLIRAKKGLDLVSRQRAHTVYKAACATLETAPHRLGMPD